MLGRPDTRFSGYQRKVPGLFSHPTNPSLGSSMEPAPGLQCEAVLLSGVAEKPWEVLVLSLPLLSIPLFKHKPLLTAQKKTATSAASRGQWWGRVEVAVRCGGLGSLLLPPHPHTSPHPSTAKAPLQATPRPCFATCTEGSFLDFPA